MAGIPLKFRCYQCNQLLGVSRSKAGAVIACPKCAAELLVPDPPAHSPGVTIDPGAVPNLSSGMESGIDLDLLDIRPEDIRVEPGAILEPPRPIPPPPLPQPPPPPREEPIPSHVYMAATSTVVEPPPIIEPARPAVNPIIQPIQLAPMKVAPERTVTTRSRDVTLPRFVVAAWSLFVLMAQGLAFLAGLLAGHYLWRVH